MRIARSHVPETQVQYATKCDEQSKSQGQPENRNEVHPYRWAFAPLLPSGQHVRPRCLLARCDVHGVVRGSFLRHHPGRYRKPQAERDQFQRETLCNLAQNPGIGHLKAIVERKCIVCKTSYKGGISRYTHTAPRASKSTCDTSGLGHRMSSCLSCGRRYRSMSGRVTARTTANTLTRQKSPKLSPMSSRET